MIERNLRWSPINIQLLSMAVSFRMESSMGTGGTFSPPAVMINSVKIQNKKQGV